MKRFVATLLTFLGVMQTSYAVSPLQFTALQNIDNTSLSYRAFQQAHNTAGSHFEYIEGQDIGLDRGFMYGLRDYTDPFWFGRGTSSGDYNQDGWVDIIFGSDQGFILYKNSGGHFERQHYSNPQISQRQVYAVAFVDLDNNGWLDIFYTTFNHGNFIVLNRQGRFELNNPIAVPNNNAVLTLSPAFADIDGDSHLDIVNGNIALGVVTGSHYMNERRNNSIVFNGGLVFRDVPMEKTSGETMASLISDLNGDDIPDIYFGNDFFIPDKILLGTGRGFKAVSGNHFVPYTPFFSMGADSGDINNDLELDFVVMGTMNVSHRLGSKAIDGNEPAKYSAFKGSSHSCNSIKHPDYRENCLAVRNSDYVNILDRQGSFDVTQCHNRSDKKQQSLCLTQAMWHLVTQDHAPTECGKNYAFDQRLFEVCEVLKLRGREYDRRNIYGQIPQDDRNMLYTFNPRTQSFDAVKTFNHPGGWTWSSRIADLDNDGWQDVFNSEGAVRNSGYGWNVFMKNINGQKFEQRQFSYGLTSDFGLYSFSLIDYDNDGDLDIVGNSAEGPVQVYNNHVAQNNHSLAISLVDSSGNHNGIGAKVYIYYDKSRKSQIREIKASGGYQSIDAPIAWFGLGKHKEIDKILIKWPDQSTTKFIGPFASNGHYRVTR